MSYPSCQGFDRSYGSSSHNQNSGYGPNSSSPAVTSPPMSPTYQPPNHQQQYGPSGYAWPDRNQASYGTMNGSTQNYGNNGWKEAQTQQSTYDYQRPQTNYPTAPRADHAHHGWHGANTQPQALPSTQGLGNLAYASGLDAQGQQAQDYHDRAAAQSRPSSMQSNAAQREEYNQERVKSPFYGRRYTSSNVGTSQTSQPEQSPTTANHNLAISAAAALAGALSRQYNSSHQQNQASHSSIANTVTLNPATAVIGSQHQRRPASSHDSKNRVQPQTQAQQPPTARGQSPRTLNSYETTETHLSAHTNGPNITLPLPSAAHNLQSRQSHESTQPQNQNSVEADRASEKPATSNVGTTTGHTTQPHNGISGQKTHEPTTSMPTFIDPSQVFNPYHKEHERQKREEADSAKRAAMEVSEAGKTSKDKEVSTNQLAKDTTTNTVSASEEQAPKAAGMDRGFISHSRPNSSSAEAKDSGEVDMAAEMKAMMQRMREWKNKDPLLFQKLWEDMKKGGSGTQPTRGQTPSQSPQLAQATPHQRAQTQSSQPAQPQISPAPETLSSNHTSAPPDSMKAAPTSQRHWDVTMVVENNQEGLPYLGRFPAEGRNRRTKIEVAEEKARKAEATRLAKIQPTHQPQTADRTKQDEKLAQPNSVIPQQPLPMNVPPQAAAPMKPDAKLTWRTQGTPQPPSTTTATSMAAQTQAVPPASTTGCTLWPEAKRKALAGAAQKALMGLAANKDKSITAAEIHTLLEQNPSYIELCAKLEARGFVFHRGQFARFLLNNVPELASPSQAQNKQSQQPAVSTAPSVTTPPIPAPKVVAGPIPPPNVSTQNGNPPPQPATYVHYRPPPAAQPKFTPNRPAKNRLGVPSPKIPAPVPGSKEAKARKRDFSELVDLTQLSDDEDYVMPRKQARYDASPEKNDFQIKSDISIRPETFMPVAKPISSMQRPLYSSSTQDPYEPRRSTALLQFDLQAQSATPQVHPRVPSQPAPVMPQKSRQLLAKPLNKAEALRKSYYDPKTVARDILIAAGRHPREHSLNAHLAGLLGKHIDLDSDLSTFDWDTVDPGGPPMPEVEAVDIPAGPPRWRLGQRAKVRGPPIGTIDPPSRGAERTKSSKHGETVSSRDDGNSSHSKIRQSRAQEGVRKESNGKIPSRDQMPEISSKHGTNSKSSDSKISQSRAQEGVRKESNGEISSRDQMLEKHGTNSKSSDSKSSDSKISPSRAQEGVSKESNGEISSRDQISDARVSLTRQSHNVSSKTLSSPTAPDRQESNTPHRSKSKSPLIATSPPPQKFHKRGPGRPRKSSVVMEQSTPAPQSARRRGRPPGSKNKHPSVVMLQKAPKSPGVQVSIPAPRRSNSPQYNIYACQWRRCDARLHNLATLRKHIAKVHKISDDKIESEGQPCWWKHCRTLKHRGENIVSAVTFNSTSDWLDHLQSDHLHPLGMRLGDGPSSAQTGKPIKPFEVSKYLYHPPKLPALNFPRFPISSTQARTSSHTDPQTLARDRALYLSDPTGRTVTGPSTKTTIANYPPDTLVLSSVTMDPESNIPNRAFSKAHGNDKMEPRQSTVETLAALQKHKERVGPGLDRGGCTLVSEERRGTLLEGEGMARVVAGDY